MLLNLKHQKYFNYNIKTKSIFILENIDKKLTKYYKEILEYNYLNLLLVSFKDKKINIINLENNEKIDLIKIYFNKYYDNLRISENDLDLLIDNNINNINITLDHKKKENFYELLELISNVLYYCNNDLVKYIYSFIPKIFNNRIKYNYNRGYPNYIYSEYNFLKASIDNLNYENIKYLIKEHQFSFWENINMNDSIIYKKNKENTINLLEILELDNINKYSNNLLIKNHLNLIKRSNSEDITIKIYNQLIGNDINKDIILNIIIDSVYNVKYNVTKYIFNSEFFNNNFINFLTNNDWIAIINQIHRFEGEKTFNNETDTFYNKNSYIKNNINKSKIAYIIFNKMLTLEETIKKKILEEIVWNSYDGNTFGNIIRLPNIIKTIRLIENLYVLHDLHYLSNILDGLLKYGYIDTMKYIFEDLKLTEDIINNKRYLIKFIIDKSLLNKNNKVCKYIINLFKNDIINLDYEFLKTPLINVNNKIIKIKILNNIYNLDKVKKEIINEIFIKEHYKEEKIDDKIIEWSISKFINNKIDNDNIFILKKIVNSYNLDLLKKYLGMTDGDINIWEIVIEALQVGYYFYDYYIQYLINIAKPLKDQDENIKKKFLRYCLSYKEKGKYELKNKFNYSEWQIKKYNNNISQDKYNNIIKFCKDNEINFNVDLYYYGTLQYIIYYGNNKFFKSAILYGVPFKEIINKHEKIGYNYVYSPTPELKYWIKLYYLIKRIQFRKHYRNKKKHYNIFTSSVVEIDSKPPLYIENKPVLKKGGYLFYRDMDEFDSLSDNYKTFIKPVHIEPYELYSLSKKDIYLTQKTDGLLVKNIDKNELYPPLDKHFNNIILDGEYIPKLNLYLIFNQRSNFTENTDYLDDYYELYSQHRYCQDNINLYDNIFRSLDSKELINEKLKRELICILTFVNIHNDIKDKKLWFPKIFWKIEDFKRNLEIISIMEQALKDNNLIEDKFIKNDGIIIMEAHNKNRIYKYKPKEEMTADLRIDNKIWRCKWNSKWIPYEIREDKEYPNPDYVIKILERYHNNPWSVEDIIKYIKIYDSSLYYQKKEKLNIYNRDYFNKYKSNLNYILDHNLKIPNGRILDLGCGYLNNILWKTDNIIDGIDIDLGIMEKYNDLKVNNKRLFLGDLSNINKRVLNNNLGKYYNQLTDLNNLREDYNIIISNMSFHNVFKTYDGFNKLMTKLNNICVDNCIMLITFIDKNLLFKDTDYIDLLYGSYIKRLNDNKIKIYYSWTHNNPIIEEILYTEFLINSMETKGWYIKEDLSNKLNLEKNNPWIKIRDSIKILSFIKK